MDNQALLAKIGVIVKEISEQHISLSGHSGSIPEPEIEISMADTRLLLGYFEVLQKVNRNQPPATLPPQSVSLPPQSVSLPPQSVSLPPQSVSPPLQPVSLPPEPVPTPLAPLVIPVFEHIPAPVVIQVPDPIPQPAQVSEAWKNIHSLLSETQTTPSRLTELDKRPVKHISQGISLNQRLLFIRSLFNGSTEVYERTMGTLENFTTEAEAIEYLDRQIAPEYGWALKKEQVLSLKNLLGRRFS